MEFIQSMWDLVKGSLITYVLAVVGFVVMLAKFLDAVKKIYGHWHEFRAGLSGRKLTDEKLREESKQLAQSILDMVTERRNSEPQVDFNNFQESTQVSIRHSQETQDMYARNYAAQVNNLRDEFLKRKLTNKDVEIFHEHPTNYLGLRALAVGLGSLAEKVKSS